MPTIDISKSDLENLMNYKIDKDNLHSFFLPVKGEVDGFDNGIIKLDVKDSNRPDLWSVEGVAREMKAHLGLDSNIPKYKFAKSKYSVKIEQLKGIRPVGCYAVAKDVNITDEFLRSLIQMQEKIALSYGKRRKEVAIGIFDLDKINGYNLRYSGFDLSKKFTALGDNEQKTLDKIVKEHPKGKEFGFLLSGFSKYPLLVDQKEEVLSMPPIINSNNSGRVDLNTKNLFIDVTGNDLDTVNTALLIICMALADRGAKVQTVKVEYEDGKVIDTPFIKERVIEFKKKAIYEYFEKLDDKKIKELLQKKRYKVKLTKDKAVLNYLNYRTDIMHYVDVIEDILISSEFNQIKPEDLSVQTIGSTLNKTEWINIVREAAIGHSLQEVMTFTLTSKKKQYQNMLIEGTPVEIANPMSESIAIFRERMLPEHLEFLSKNQHIEYPQNIFEVGQVLSTDGKEVFEKQALCVTICHNDANFSTVKSILLSILKNIGAKDIVTTAKEFNYLIEGRSAQIEYTINGKKRIGIIGEVNPRVLLNFNLEMPVSMFQIDIDKE